MAITSSASSAAQSKESSTSSARASVPIDPSVLGFASIPELPSPEAVAANHRGFADYQHKSIGSALLHFEEAVAKAPDFDLARYNATAMLALLGRHAESSRALYSLLRRDLPRFYPRLLADPDFEGFRRSATGESLLRVTESLRDAWLELAKGWRQLNRDLLLPDGRRIKLPARDSWAALDLVEIPTRDQAILVVVRAGCECNGTEASVLEYAIEVLDLLKLTVTPWNHGKGMAAAYVDADQHIYLQRNERLERFERAGDKNPTERLPEGMLLCPPMIPDDNCCSL